MSHANARLTFHARVELVRRVRSAGRPAAHVAAEMGVSRQCAHRWLARFDAEGVAGLHDRSSRPRSSPTRTPVESRRRSWPAAISSGSDEIGWPRRPGCRPGP